MAAERDVMQDSAKKFNTLEVSGNYAKVAEGLNVPSIRVEKPDAIASAFKEGIKITESGKPVLLEFVVKEGYDFSRYPLPGL
jgi:acetolactate synthase-1/2/3 large subunit